MFIINISFKTSWVVFEINLHLKESIKMTECIQTPLCQNAENSFNMS